MLLIGNGRVITRDSDHPYFEKGAVVIDGDHILEVGEESKGEVVLGDDPAMANPSEPKVVFEKPE